jgi:hypothetical protein
MQKTCDRCREKSRLKYQKEKERAAVVRSIMDRMDEGKKKRKADGEQGGNGKAKKAKGEDGKVKTRVPLEDVSMSNKATKPKKVSPFNLKMLS